MFSNSCLRIAIVPFLAIRYEQRWAALLPTAKKISDLEFGIADSDLTKANLNPQSEIPIPKSSYLSLIKARLTCIAFRI